MGTFGIVVGQPPLEIGLRRTHRDIELGARCLPEEFIQDGAVEPLRKAVGSEQGDFDFSMSDIVQLFKI